MTVKPPRLRLQNVEQQIRLVFSGTLNGDAAIGQGVRHPRFGCCDGPRSLARKRGHLSWSRTAGGWHKANGARNCQRRNEGFIWIPLNRRFVSTGGGPSCLPMPRKPSAHIPARNRDGTRSPCARSTAV